MANDRPKRKAIPLRIKRDVCERQDFRCKDCPATVKPEAGSGTCYDHRPSLRMRDIRPDGSDFEPGQHSSEHIDALCTECHKVRTFRHNGADFSDSTHHKRERRREKARRGEGKKKKAWPKGRKIASRPFQKKKDWSWK